MPTLQGIAAEQSSSRQERARLVDVSIVIVSYNTRELLDECLRTLDLGRSQYCAEVFVVDNASKDRSAEMVTLRYPDVKLIRSEANLGFGPANNVALQAATGRYVLLLNSDAFLPPDVLGRAIELMDKNPEVAIGGAKLIGRDGSWQPSGRGFPTALNYLFMVTGLSHRYRNRRFFSSLDRTWRSDHESSDVDWVTGAFMIMRSPVLREIGFFDPAFFLYYEEVDLCRRARQAGHVVRYWPELCLVHAAGASSKTVAHLELCSFSSQLTLWSMRSALLYFRKHHGWQAHLIFSIETGWHGMRAVLNSLRGGAMADLKRTQSKRMVKCMRQAWRDTSGGRVSPKQPW